MTKLYRAARRGAAAVAFAAAAGACAGSNLGNVLGSVLGGAGGAGGQSGQVSGAVLGVDTQNQQIVLQTSDGQRVGLSYDGQTSVVFQNQRYAVTNLERGDRVTARIQSTSNGGYYTDMVQVDQSVSSGGGGMSGAGNVQSFQGIVRQLDNRNGAFSMDVGNGTVIVTLPYSASRADVNRFNRLRTGERVRLYGVLVNNSRIELRQFY